MYLHRQVDEVGSVRKFGGDSPVVLNMLRADKPAGNRHTETARSEAVFFFFRCILRKSQKIIRLEDGLLNQVLFSLPKI
mgnify:FL=1|jgi:hypothetical protein